MATEDIKMNDYTAQEWGIILEEVNGTMRRINLPQWDIITLIGCIKSTPDLYKILLLPYEDLPLYINSTKGYIPLHVNNKPVPAYCFYEAAIAKWRLKIGR